ncbi:MAG: uracil-DNA glycosylase [Acidobacteria bacterium]|nr:uracil-DNA glycosylase [Acidobacteriota bacterium]
MSLRSLAASIVACNQCPRLREHCANVAVVKRRAYQAETYWGRPVPGFGDPAARLLILGLAPGAHGANRTGRVFTGDRSGDFLFRALHETGFANQPTSTHRDDGLALKDAWISASVRCAPPDNKPDPTEIRTCQPFLEREIKLLKNLQGVVVLGRLAFDVYSRIAKLPKLDFGHNLLHSEPKPWLLCSYHPSQQNTSTGRLTREMLHDVFALAQRRLATESKSA